MPPAPKIPRVVGRPLLPLLPVRPDSGVRPDTGWSPASGPAAPSADVTGATALCITLPGITLPADRLFVLPVIAPPAQPAVESPSTAAALPQTSRGMLTGMLTSLPLPTDTFPLATPDGPVCDGPGAGRLAVAPPRQSARAMPRRAPALSQTLAGMLTGARSLLLLSTEALPEVLLPPVPARATPDKPPPAAAKPTASRAVFAVHDAHGRMGTP